MSVYDAGGQRVATQVGGSLTNVLVYDVSGKLVAEYGSSATLGGTQYLFSDQHGSPRAITGTTGTVISRHDYAPFGEEIGTVGMRTSSQGYTAGDNARQKYAGMETDDATGMAHTLWRQYDSFSGRWTAPDPYGGSMSIGSPQSFNRYSYVNNDPVNKVDPTGLMLSDIGVYQTANPEAARLTERAEDQGVKNWVTRHQETPHTTDHSSHFGGPGNSGNGHEANHTGGSGPEGHADSGSPSSGVHGEPQNSGRILIIVGDRGLNETIDGVRREHNVGPNFDRVAATKKKNLEALSYTVIVTRASSFADVNAAMNNNGMLDGVEYVGHAAPWALFVGERHEPGTNVDLSNVSQLSGAHLNPNAYIKLTACYAGFGGWSNIAGKMANHLDRPVSAFNGWAIFSSSESQRVPFSRSSPLYLIEDRGTSLVTYNPR